MWRNILREIFKAIMIAQFVTPSESCLREKSFSKNAEQVRSPYMILIFDLALVGCRSVRAHTLDIVAHGHNTGVHGVYVCA